MTLCFAAHDLDVEAKQQLAGSFERQLGDKDDVIAMYETKVSYVSSQSSAILQLVSSQFPVSL